MTSPAPTDPQAGLALVGGRVVGPDSVATGLAVLCRGRSIAAIVPEEELGGFGPGVDRVDVGGRLVTPGLIDLHIHGAAGHAFNELDDSAYQTILGYLARHGVTSVQASMASADLAEHRRQLEYVAELSGRLDPARTRLLGAHLEGPYLARDQCGAHDPRLLRTPGPDDAKRLLAAGAPTMVTVAPELPRAIELIADLAGAGVVIAVGHSAAREEDLRAARDAGATHLTHLWSGMSNLTREGPWRVPGLVDASLASDGMTAEVIADGKHLPPALLEVARRCLGDRLCVVSDATSGTGLPEGTRYQVGRIDCEVRDGVGVVLGEDIFGGSVTPVNAMLAHLAGDLGWPLPQAVTMATSRPAGVLGLGARTGRIEAGYDADLAVFEDDFTAWATMIGGRWVHGPL